jgi:methionyl-tRNA synthetase
MGDLEEQGTASAEQEYGLPVDAPRERSRAEHGSTIVARSPAVSSGEATALYSASTVSYYVTTPIYYVNAEPHLGHAYSTIAADILARHMRQRGEDVFFLTGTDEHGEPVAQAAEKLGVEPRELVDRNAPKFKQLLPQINASNDFFIRTSDPQHEAKVQEIVQIVHDNGYVYEGTYEGWYCPKCADFKTELELGPGHTCPIHKIPLEREREENWFFKLSAFQEQLERLYREQPDFVQPQARFNEALSFIRGGLEDVSLSRPKLTWGVRLPWDPKQVMYVWFDALLNYVTALSYAREGEDLTERYWPAFHIIGKDILKFHAVYWPAFLMAAGYELPKGMFIHGYLLMEGHKMSKSLGNVLDPFEVIERFGADALRYYCFREVSFGQDGSVSAAGFEARYDSELANEYGNLASRTLAMIDQFRDGRVPEAQPDPELAGGGDGLDGLEAKVSELLDRAELSQALEEIWKRVRRLNRYVEETRPWDLAKDDAQAERLDQVLYNLAEGLRMTTLLVTAYMPETGDRMLEALGVEGREIDAFGSHAGGQSIEALPPLFPKIEAAPA